MTPAGPDDGLGYGARLRLDGRLAVVIGAGHGIGREIAVALASVGATTVCVSKKTPDAEAVAAEVGGIAMTADATRREDLERVMGHATETDLPVATIVDVVGMARFKDLLDVDDRDWDFAVELNARHAVRVATMGGAVPSDVASAVLFLATDLGSFVSGRNLVVDGALTVRSAFEDHTL